MLRRLRTARRTAGLLVLAIFAAWIGVASFHHHPASGPCEVCKGLHATHASLPASSPAPRLSLTVQRVDSAGLSGPREPHRILPRNRAPPIA